MFACLIVVFGGKVPCLIERYIEDSKNVNDFLKILFILKLIRKNIFKNSFSQIIFSFGQKNRKIKFEFIDEIKVGDHSKSY